MPALADPDRAVQVIGENRFDFVLGSLHKTRKYGDMMMLNYAHPALDLQDVFRSYYEELLEVVQWGHFDSLAHLGYPLRYLKPYNRTVDLAQIDDVFAEIMKSLVAQGRRWNSIPAVCAWRSKPLPRPTSTCRCTRLRR